MGHRVYLGIIAVRVDAAHRAHAFVRHKMTGASIMVDRTVIVVQTYVVSMDDANVYRRENHVQ